MDYATTFCDYAEFNSARGHERTRRWGILAPVLTMQTIATGSAVTQLAATWCIFSISFIAFSGGHTDAKAIMTAGLVTGLLGLYWLNAGVFATRRLTETRGLNRTLALWVNSFAASTLAIFAYSHVTRGHSSVQDTLLAGSMIIFVFAGVAAITRQFLYYAIRQQRLACEIVLAGDPSMMHRIIRDLRENHGSVHIRGIFCFNMTGQPDDIEGVPVRGDIPDLLSYHARNPQPRVILVSQGQADREAEFLNQMRMQPLHVLAPADMLNENEDSLKICPAGVPGLKLTPIFTPPLTSFDHIMKGSFDRMAGLAALLAFAPVMLACAVIIKLTSPGPVLYQQRRIGYRNNMFNVYKFRSMHVEDCDKLVLTKRGDARVFAFGRLMRKLSLDELPQLFNVIRGDMSLVGPRPHMREARAGERLYYEVVYDYASRHRVKPGITGWAQINGWRGPTDTDQSIRARVEHDLYYIENWSFWLDLKILYRTLAGGFSGSNAV